MTAAKRITPWLVLIASALACRLPASASRHAVLHLETRAEVFSTTTTKRLEFGFATRETASSYYDAFGEAASDSPVAPKSGLANVDVVTAQGGFVRYGALDEFGRPTQMQARITQDMIGTGSAASSRIQPPGFITGARGANRARGHLLGDKLGGSGREVRNLVTLEQNSANSPVTWDFETAIRQAVEGGQIVDYTVAPLWNFTE